MSETKHSYLKDGSVLSIVYAKSEQASQIVSFLNHVGGETDFLTFGHNEFDVSVAQEKEIIRECLEDYYGNIMLIGQIDNNIVSHLMLQRDKSSRTQHVGHLGLSVSKKCWGLSIGKHMMLHAIDVALPRGITKMQLQIRTDNNRGYNLYKKLGFNVEGTLKKSIKIQNDYFDEYIMCLNP